MSTRTARDLAAARALGRAASWLCCGDRLIGAMLALLAVYYVCSPGIFQGKGSGDGLVDFTFLPSVFKYGTLDIARATRDANHWPMPVMNGRMTNYLPIGPPLLWSPMYLVSLGLEAAARPLGALTGQPFGVNRFSYWMCGLATLCWSLLGVRALYLVLARRLGAGAARIGTVGAVLGTPLTWYIVTQPLYQHALSFTMCTLLVERWDAWRDDLTTRRVLALGALGGLAALVRQQDVLFLLLPAWDLLRRPGRLAILGGAAIIVFLPQLVLWRYYYGDFRSPLMSTGFMRWTEPSFVGVLFSMRGGLIAWSPIVWLSLVGWLLLLRRLPRLTGMLLAVFALELYVNACVWDWWASWSYGARRFCGLVVVFAFGIAGAWAHKRWRPMLTVACAVLVAGNLVAGEYVRARRTPSSGTTRAAWERLEAVGAPRALVSTLRTVGWPFLWPASIPFALHHGVPVRAFEEVYGGYLCEREQWEHEVINSIAVPARPAMRRYFVSGFGSPEPGTSRCLVDGPARVLVPLFRREPMRIRFEGSIPPGVVGARWNDDPVEVRRDGTGVALDLPAGLVRKDVNRVELFLPPGSYVAAMKCEPTGTEENFHGPPWNRR
jgi:hypothetical protein